MAYRGIALRRAHRVGLLMLDICPNACATTVVRAGIARTREGSYVFARGYGVSTEAMLK